MLQSKTYFKLQCLLCNGKKCKHENWKNTILTDKTSLIAIDGLNSHWVTKNIIASQRPSNKLIEQYDILKQFHLKGITHVINLQEHGEHPNCGDGIVNGGFSYDPEIFMNDGIHYHNFAFQDMETPPMRQIFDMMHVMAGVIQHEGKILVHCHAGKGRTGLVIACFLLFLGKADEADEAINIVREKRPKSIQTKGQVKFVHSFLRVLKSIRCIYPKADPQNIHFSPSLRRLSAKLLESPKTPTKTSPSPKNNSVISWPPIQLTPQGENVLHAINLEQLMTNQQFVLYGSERRSLAHLPKVVHDICKQLRGLLLTEQDGILYLQNLHRACSSALSTQVYRYTYEALIQAKNDLNQFNFGIIHSSSNMFLLVRLLFDFFANLSHPLFTYEVMTITQMSRDVSFLANGIKRPERSIIIAFLRILKDWWVSFGTISASPSNADVGSISLNESEIMDEDEEDDIIPVVPVIESFDKENENPKTENSIRKEYSISSHLDSEDDLISLNESDLIRGILTMFVERITTCGTYTSASITPEHGTDLMICMLNAIQDLHFLKPTKREQHLARHRAHSVSKRYKPKPILGERSINSIQPVLNTTSIEQTKTVVFDANDISESDESPSSSMQQLPIQAV